LAPLTSPASQWLQSEAFDLVLDLGKTPQESARAALRYFSFSSRVKRSGSASDGGQTA
jgi:hypothetical protein